MLPPNFLKGDEFLLSNIVDCVAPDMLIKGSPMVTFIDNEQGGLLKLRDNDSLFTMRNRGHSIEELVFKAAVAWNQLFD